MSKKVHIDDVLNHLVADTIVPSNFGAQLDRLRYGLTGAPDPVKARRDAEDRLLEQAGILRVVDGFAKVEQFRASSPMGESYKALEKIQRHARRPQGQIATGVISAYQKWVTNAGHERGFLAVYAYLAKVAPAITPPVELEFDKALQSFRDGTARKAREFATSAYADSILALAAYLKRQ